MEAWEEEAFEILGLGPAVATACAGRGLIRSVAGSCSMSSGPVEFSAEWRVEPDALPVVVCFAAGRGHGIRPRLDAATSDRVQELVESALNEWWSTPKAREMAEANETMVTPGADTQAALLALRKALEDGVQSVAEMERLILDVRRDGRQVRTI
jgi:hypothetical protein